MWGLSWWPSCSIAAFLIAASLVFVLGFAPVLWERVVAEGLSWETAALILPLALPALAMLAAAIFIIISPRRGQCPLSRDDTEDTAR